MSDVTSHITLEILALKKIVSAFYCTLGPSERARLDVMLMDKSSLDGEIKSPSLQLEIQDKINKILL
ncbi:hypothetical protein ACSMDF_13545 [Yersinia enterocolitica]|uniref:Uncharacterized protein n=2 Tax=Yersinia TaxID=629 RepID=A0AAI8ZS15_YERFR|nr:MULTISPECIES: hypothetical protein [Yersinia]ATM87022.1 hypothetical protein CRN74_13620 [Yersinia frederiksenii]AVX38695.1 hypothetical protein DA391_14050 [Yersinia massiliensis]MDN0129609.1 hypothetical protein [Yersinia massiliensis]CFR04327.1 Uncharacterised protein [Yersinia frederiksenii]CNJ94983.1 Uncharacterised protein [Yersinia frederiksenii]